MKVEVEVEVREEEVAATVAKGNYTVRTSAQCFGLEEFALDEQPADTFRL